jgi:hypothetical protein
MDPDDLALLNQWLAGVNPQGGYQPLADQSAQQSGGSAQGLQGPPRES